MYGINPLLYPGEAGRGPCLEDLALPTNNKFRVFSVLVRLSKAYLRRHARVILFTGTIVVVLCLSINSQPVSLRSEVSYSQTTACGSFVSRQRAVRSQMAVHSQIWGGPGVHRCSSICNCHPVSEADIGAYCTFTWNDRSNAVLLRQRLGS